MLDEYDKQAILALLIRQVRAQDINAREVAIRDAAVQKIKETETARANIREALKAFGFDPKTTNLWDQIREAIGSALFDGAFEIARRPPPLQIEAPTQSEVEEVGDEEEPNFPDSEGDPEDDAQEDSESGVTATNTQRTNETATDSEDDKDRLNIRELVLEQLNVAGSAGMEAASLRKVIEQTIKSSIHVKTVGMTLWRLSKVGLVRREGRTWFRVNNQTTAGDSAENEGAPAVEKEEAPGSLFA